MVPQRSPCPGGQHAPQRVGSASEQRGPAHGGVSRGLGAGVPWSTLCAETCRHPVNLALIVGLGFCAWNAGNSGALAPCRINGRYFYSALCWHHRHADGITSQPHSGCLLLVTENIGNLGSTAASTNEGSGENRSRDGLCHSLFVEAELLECLPHRSNFPP